MDAGANDGGYTQRMLDLGLDVVAFEPVPDVFDRLYVRHSGDPWVTLRRMGLSDRAHLETDLTVLSCWTLGRRDIGLDPALEYKDRPPFSVQFTTLDRELELPPSIIKLDVDGYEYRVLRGAVRSVKNHPPILCELNCYIHKLGESPQEFMEFVLGLGYTVIPLDGRLRFDSWAEIEPYWPWHSSFDVLFVRNDFKPEEAHK